MGLAFEWDERKAVSDLRKHGVGFDEAATAFGDPLSLTMRILIILRRKIASF